MEITVYGENKDSYDISIIAMDIKWNSKLYKLHRAQNK